MTVILFLALTIFNYLLEQVISILDTVINTIIITTIKKNNFFVRVKARIIKKKCL